MSGASQLYVVIDDTHVERIGFLRYQVVAHCQHPITDRLHTCPILAVRGTRRKARREARELIGRLWPTADPPAGYSNPGDRTRW